MTVMMPARAQTVSSQPEVPTSRTISAETMKMPEPIMAPATSMVASKSPIRCWKPAAGSIGSTATGRLPPDIRFGSRGGRFDLLESVAELVAEDAVVSAVGEVNDQAEEHPAKQTHPVTHWQRHHQHQAEDDAQHGDYRDERTTEGPVRAGVGPPHHQHRGAHDDEGEQRADVGQLQQGVDRQEPCQDGYEEADGDRAFPRRAEGGMDVGEESLGDEAIASHRQENARAGQHHD